MSKNKVRLRVLRQNPAEKSVARHWDVFEVSRFPRMTVLDVLRRIEREPVTKDGKRVQPVVWDCSCQEELCGACAMLVDGVVRMACGTLVDDVSPKGKLISLEPLTKFPVVRDLVVDRKKMFDDLGRVRAWVEVDGTRDVGVGVEESVWEQQRRYELSRCVTCGCCVEACPSVNDSSDFMGAAAMNQVSYWGMYPRRDVLREERLESLMRVGGAAECGHAQVCAEVCPMSIPLVESFGRVARETSKHLLFRWMFGAGK